MPKLKISYQHQDFCPLDNACYRYPAPILRNNKFVPTTSLPEVGSLGGGKDASKFIGAPGARLQLLGHTCQREQRKEFHKRCRAGFFSLGTISQRHGGTDP